MLDDATDSRVEEGKTTVVYVLSEFEGTATMTDDEEVGKIVV